MENIKHLWKFFVLIFIISALLFNWSEIALFSNYQVIWHNIKSLFNSENRRPEPLISQHIGEVELEIQQEAEKPEPEPKPAVITGSYIKISKINVRAPILLGAGDYQASKAVLKKGVMLYQGGSMPGQAGITYILGHSAPAGWPDINYDNVFNKINQLGSGDQIIVQFNNQQFVYQVISQTIFFPQDEDKAFQSYESSSDNILILITCWPLGKDYKRLAVFSKLLDKK